MALTDNSNSGFYMPVAPAYGGGYGNNGGGFFGGDWAWILLLLLIGGNGWGFGGGFGMGGMMWPMMMGGMGAGFGLDYLYPWLNNSQHISDGFRDQQLNTQVGDLRSDVNRGFGDVQLGIAGVNQNICSTGNSITGAVRDGFSAAEIAANGRQMASMQQGYGIQTAMMQGQNAIQGQLAQCCCDNRLATCQTQNIIQAEAAANRAAGTADTQRILDKLCDIEKDTLRTRLEAKDDIIAQLRQEILFARGQASQIDQTAQIRAGQATTANQLVSELRSCPIPAQPVYGNQPIFNCQNNGYNGFGCTCGAA